MVHSNLSAKDRLIFALDVSSAVEAVKWVRTLETLVGCFKIGLELFIKEGPAAIRAVQENSSACIFLDLKLHDIPATLSGALRSASHFGIRYITAHCEPGFSPIISQLQPLPSDLKVLGITVLTSLGEKQLPAMGIRDCMTLQELTLNRTDMAREMGCAGVVCSGQEATAIRNYCGNDFLIITPGIRPEWSETVGDDQTRVTTPRTAIASGADLIVVGRPIRMASDPRSAAIKTAEEINQGMEDRK